MAVDFSSTSLFGRVSVLIEPDCLIRLEHQRARDRVRKTMFDRVEQVIVYRQFPIVRMVLVAIFLGLPGAMFFLGALVADQTDTRIGCLFFALPLLVISGALMGFYVYCRKTTIRLVRGGRNDDIIGIFRPSKVTVAVAKIIGNIRNTQSIGFALIAARQAAATAAAPAEPPFDAAPSPLDRGPDDDIFATTAEPIPTVEELALEEITSASPELHPPSIPDPRDTPHDDSRDIPPPPTSSF